MAWLPAVVTAAPASEPITLAEAKAQCHIDGTDFDTELAIYIQAAREHIEKYTGTKLVTQTVVLRASCFGDLGALPVAPAQSVSSITYLDGDGAEQTLATTVYEGVLIGLSPAVRLKINQSWPAVRPVSDAVRVTAVVGYGAAAAVPVPVKQALLLTVAKWFGDREAGEIPEAACSLLANYRMF